MDSGSSLELQSDYWWDARMVILSGKEWAKRSMESTRAMPLVMDTPLGNCRDTWILALSPLQL